MADTITSQKMLQGCEFIITEANKTDIFTPEMKDEEMNMISDTVRDFIETEILPIYDKIEHQEEGVNKSLCKKFGDLGLFSTHMPESLGGMNLDFNTNTLIGEVIGGSGSFSVTYNAHTGIGMLPILYYGTQTQKERYLPDLMSGVKVASYCLTEPSSGSDALSAKAKAVLTEDGKHYILNGQKMWITNAGFADLFTVFAQVDGDKFTGFLVDRDTPGLSLGEEEKKLGIKGSSTRMVYLEDVKIPVENVLGEVGKGHLIAFNVLNTGRFKLGASTVGSTKAVFDMAVKYANERQQFNTPIASFGAIQHKLAEMSIKTFVSESALYMCSHQIDHKIKDLKSEGMDYGMAKLKAAEEYAMECSILKILGSETLDYTVDENVQIHGGMGFSEEALAARAFRDARINRIFEGTNEINRMVIMSIVLKRAMNGQLDIVTPALAVQSELTNGIKPAEEAGSYSAERQVVKGFKKILLMLLGSAAKLQMEGKLDLKKEQELLMNLADIILDIYSTESTLMRIDKAVELDKTQHLDLFEAILKVHTHDAVARVNKNAMDAVGTFIKPEKHGDFIYGIRKYAKYPLQNVKGLRRLIAAHQIEANTYAL